MVCQVKPVLHCFLKKDASADNDVNEHERQNESGKHDEAANCNKGKTQEI